MTSGSSALPRWDLAPLFPGPDSPELQSSVAAIVKSLGSVAALLDTWDAATPPEAEAVGAAEELVSRYIDLQAAARRVEIYLVCLVAADATGAAGQAALSALRQQLVRLPLLATRFAAWTASLPLDDLAIQSVVMREHAFALRQLQQSAAHQMSPAEEALAAELAPTGAPAWSRLRQDIEAQLTITVTIDGEEQTLPISEALNLALHPDRAVRQTADDASRAAWRSVAVPVAAALNGVKGETLVLADRRGWDDPLDAALLRNHIDRPILDALLEAIRSALPDYGRYLRAKAVALGLPVLAWYDLLAPVGVSERAWPFDEAIAFITDQFAQLSPRLAALATRAVAEQWIDVGPRPGKEGGGFCAAFEEGASRILLNYAPTYLWMSATAHELGHAYHNAVHYEYGRSWLQRSLVPPTLAETASTFCETVVHRAALAEADDTERLAILGGVLLSADLNVFGAVAGFGFEQELFAARRARALSTDELAALNLTAQQSVFGDAVDPVTISPYGWAELPHPFIADLSYYNFPYAFGMLFAIGLYAEYRADPAGFWPRFDDLLAGAWSASAADLAARMGIDLRAPAFWQQALAVIRADIDDFERLVVVSAPAADAPPTCGNCGGVIALTDVICPHCGISLVAG